MKKTCLILTCLILASCVSKKEITKKEVKSDSIKIETNKIRIDTIYKEKIVNKFEPIHSEVEIPCDTAKLSQSFGAGKTNIKIIKEKGKVKILYKSSPNDLICENQYKVLLRQNDSLKSIKSKSNIIENKEVVKKPFFANLWQILFFIVFVLWILGITPIFIFKKIII